MLYTIYLIAASLAALIAIAVGTYTLHTQIGRHAASLRALIFRVRYDRNRLRWEVHQFEMILEKNGIACYRLDADLNLIYLNKPGMVLLHATELQYAEKRWADALDPEDKESAISAWERARDRRTPYRRLNWLQPNGVRYLADVRAENYVLNGKTSRFLGTFKEVPSDTETS